MVDGSVEGCPLWVMQNIQKFSKLMGVSLKGMKDFTYLFFSEIKKKKIVEE